MLLNNSFMRQLKFPPFPGLGAGSPCRETRLQASLLMALVGLRRTQVSLLQVQAESAPGAQGR